MKYLKEYESKQEFLADKEKLITPWVIRYSVEDEYDSEESGTGIDLPNMGDYIYNGGDEELYKGTLKEGDYIYYETGQYTSPIGTLVNNGDCLIKDGDYITTMNLNSIGDYTYNDGSEMETGTDFPTSDGEYIYYNDGIHTDSGFPTSDGEYIYYNDGIHTDSGFPTSNREYLYNDNDGIKTGTDFPTEHREYLYNDNDTIETGTDFPTSDGEYIYYNDGIHTDSGFPTSNGDYIYYNEGIQAGSLVSPGDYLYNDGSSISSGTLEEGATYKFENDELVRID